MLSRVAESIYWMCRYVERAENVARFISVNLNLNLDMPGEQVQQWLPLVITSGDQAAFNKSCTAQPRKRDSFLDVRAQVELGLVVPHVRP